MLHSSVKRFQDFINTIARKYDGSPTGKESGIGVIGWICWIFRLAGVGFFFLAIFLCFAPWMWGWFLFDTLVAVSATLLISQVFMNFHELMADVTGTLHFLIRLMRGKKSWND